MLSLVLKTALPVCRYCLFTYLAVMRLEELGNGQFQDFVLAQDPHKMLVWMEFLFSEKYLNEFLREEWLKIYDKQFVDDRIGTAEVIMSPKLNSILSEYLDPVHIHIFCHENYRFSGCRNR